MEAPASETPREKSACEPRDRAVRARPAARSISRHDHARWPAAPAAPPPRPASGSCPGAGWSTRTGRSRSCPPTRSRPIHVASLRDPREIGMEVLGDRALDALARRGARVDRDDAAWSASIRPRSRRSSRWRRASSGCTPATRSATSCSAARTSSSAPSAARRSSATSTAAGGPATSPTSSTTCGSSARSTCSTRRAAARWSRPTCRSRPAISTSTGRSRPSSTRRGTAWAPARPWSTTRSRSRR